MIDPKLGDWLMIVLGALMVSTSRGAYSWLSSTWRMGGSGASDSWWAAAIGPRLVRALCVLIGLALVLAGSLALLGLS